MIKNVMLRFDKYLHETCKAYLIKYNNKEYWLPKKLCRNMIVNKKLAGNVVIPTWLYTKITGIEEEDIQLPDATFIVLKYVTNKNHSLVKNT